MPEMYDESRFGCSCGCQDVGSHNYHGEEYGLWKCAQCGNTDYPDAFDNAVAFIDDECLTCKKETKHKLSHLDNWSGTTKFKCVKCETETQYEFKGSDVFERIVKE